MKNSTNELPMMSLNKACKLITDIHEKGVETEDMKNVAKVCGYAAPTSTPFYRSVVAARLLGLLQPTNAELSSLGLDYLKPDTENGSQQSLVQAIQTVPAYEPLLERYAGKRLNVDIITNNIMRSHDLTKSCASTCAKAFIQSLKFAGLLDADNTFVRMERAEAKNDVAESTITATKSASQMSPIQEGLETYFLTLDASEKRRIVVQAPPVVTAKELKRIQEWLSFQLSVEGETSAEDK